MKAYTALRAAEETAPQEVAARTRVPVSVILDCLAAGMKVDTEGS
jgi:hypothetical protein